MAVHAVTIVIIGDINLHLDDQSASSTISFTSILSGADLVQHIVAPTYRAGHTLDVVITQSSTPVTVIVEPPTISDHSLVVSDFLLGASTEPRVGEPTVFKRDWKTLDDDAFRNDLLSSSFVTDPTDDVSALFDTYDQTLRTLVDMDVPAKQVINHKRPSSPWFNHRCYEAKAVTR